MRLPRPAHPPARWAGCDARPCTLRARQRPPCRALPPALAADVAAAAASSSHLLPEFEARLNPAALVGAACAAVPPIVFWARIAVNARKRVKKEADDERDRLARLERLKGGGGGT